MANAVTFTAADAVCKAAVGKVFEPTSLSNFNNVIGVWLASRNNKDVWIGVDASTNNAPVFKSNNAAIGYTPPYTGNPGTDACTFVKGSNQKWKTAACTATEDFMCEFPLA